jgi:Flp pilus assembly protein TadG
MHGQWQAPPWRGDGGERGSATVEAAIAVCAVVVMLAMALAGSAAVLAQMRCIDAAREAARLVARGESARAEQAARRVAPTGASIVVHVQGDEAVVEVAAESAGGVLPGLSVRAEAIAIVEPGVAGAG